MDEESIRRICVSAFSESDIRNAKELLISSISTTKRNKTRKNKGKTACEIEDIVSLLKQTDPEDVPVFVARDLQKLPPVNDLRIEFESLKNTSIINNFQRNVNTKRGGAALTSFEYDSGPMGLSPVCNSVFWPDGVNYRRFVEFNRSSLKNDYRDIDKSKLIIITNAHGKCSELSIFTGNYIKLPRDRGKYRHKLWNFVWNGERMVRARRGKGDTG
ncbi:hypothetical protein ACJJTC_007868 [Scirpophaga incertulas]